MHENITSQVNNYDGLNRSSVLEPRSRKGDPDAYCDSNKLSINVLTCQKRYYRRGGFVDHKESKKQKQYHYLEGQFG